jgi:hypothetical protein
MTIYFANQYAQTMAEIIGIGGFQDYLFWAYDGLGLSPDEFLSPTEVNRINSDWNSIKEDVMGTLNEDGTRTGGYQC